jgi:hypothetical protein
MLVNPVAAIIIGLVDVEIGSKVCWIETGALVTVLIATVTTTGFWKVSTIAQRLVPVIPTPAVNAVVAIVPTEIAVTLKNSATVVAVALFGPVSVVDTAYPDVSIPEIVKVDELMFPVDVSVIVR